ncbi:tRNA (guanine(10)-N(2))-dimethyltransferase [Candidatus Woesearchaeota archaeon]|nr:tRNA (guanine(10)-N(2))-dimethyltransferase [Candidatus Woesearchaeota archaeon]
MQKVVSAGMAVFYNPVMSLNRDLSVILLKSIGKRKLVVADPLAGTGVRSLRFLKELPGMIEELRANDGNPRFPALFRKQLKLNKIPSKNVVVARREASSFLLDGPGFDYVDVDPFGSPNPFLDAACKKLSRDGIIAVTATDTGALAGSFPDACHRKYWAEPLRNELMHEVGIRILIRKVQLIASQYDRALVPIFVHATQHYDRVYLHCEKSRSYVKALLDKHGYLLYCERCMDRAVSNANVGMCSCGEPFKAAGPMWLGPLWNHALVKKMLVTSKGDAEKLLSVIHQESHIPIVGFFDIHKICSLLKVPVPKTAEVIAALKRKGHDVGLTHFSPTGIRTDAPLEEVKSIIARLK